MSLITIRSFKKYMKRIFFQHRSLFLLVMLLANGRPAVAESVLRPFTQREADSIRVLLSKSKVDTNRANYLIQLAQFYVYKQFEYKADLDSAFFFNKQAFALTKTLVFKRGEIRSMYVMGSIHRERGDKRLAELNFTGAINMCRKMGYLTLEAEGWCYLAEIYDRHDKTIPKAIGYYKRSMDLYAAAGKTEQQAYILKAIADLNLLSGNLEVSLKQLHEVLRLYQSVNFSRLHHTYFMLAVVNRVMGNYQDALQYGLAAVEGSRTAKDTADISLFYFELGNIHDQLDQREAAIGYHKRYLYRAQEVKDTLSVLAISKMIGLNYLKLKRPAEAITFFKKVLRNFPSKNEATGVQVAGMLCKYYLYKKDYSKAEKYLLIILDYEARTRGLTADKIDLYQEAADFYIEVGKYAKAREYLAPVLIWNKKHGPSLLYASLKLRHSMFKIDSAQGKYKSAIGHYQLYKALNDSIFNETKSRQIASIQIQYDTKKKEQHNALLRRRNQAQQASIRQKDFQRNAAFAGAVMLMLLLGLSYNQYRIKKRTNAQLQVKQQEISLKNIRQQHLLEEKEWLLREIHHRVKNNLQTVMSLLESQSSYLKNDALAAIKDSQHRVHAMSLIHQKLYLSDNVTTIDMRVYIEQLVSYLRDSFDLRQRIRFEFDLEPVSLDIAQAIPIGLILNEAITNSIKYAFPDGMEGIIGTSIKQPSEGRFELVIRDDGIGLPAEFENLNATSLGVRLMRGLSNEIGGRLTMTSQGGTSVAVSFEVEKVFRKTVSIFNKQTEFQL